MDSTAVIVLMYLAGLALVIAEVFVPSHGMLTLGALACFGVALYHTFAHTTTGGAIALVACLILVPTVLILGIKNVHRLPMGDKIAPPNPVAADSQYDADRSACAALVGQVGRVLTPLRPVGICDFNGARVSCVAEAGIIDAGETVIGVDVHLVNLVVRPHGDPKDARRDVRGEQLA